MNTLYWVGAAGVAALLVVYVTAQTRNSRGDREFNLRRSRDLLALALIGIAAVVGAAGWLAAKLF